VSSFWKRHDDGLEGELRRGRAEPREEFVASVAERVRPRRKSYRGMRVGVAIALTIGMLAALAPIGAASYAGSAAVRLVSTASHVLGPASHAGVAAKGTAASKQYPKPKKHKKKKPPKKHKAAKKHKAKKSGRAGVRAHRGPAFTG
jgi:hypothetical protein